MSLILDGTNGLSDIDGTAATPAIRGTDTNTGIFFPAADTIAFSEGGAESMRIDGSGNLAVGITSAGFRITAASASASNGIVAQFQNSGLTGCGINFAQNGVDDFSLTMPAATGGLRFIASGVNERMRIDSSGNLLVGTTAVTGAGGFTVRPNLGGAGTFCRLTLNSVGTNDVFDFLQNGTQVGRIQIAATQTFYVTTSDYRLKENIAPMTGALAKVTQLKPCTYTWKSNSSNGQGFIAHELAEVCPEAVVGEKDAVNEDGSINPQGIDTSFLVATLTAAIQELKATVDAQAARIAALENPPVES